MDLDLSVALGQRFKYRLWCFMAGASLPVRQTPARGYPDDMLAAFALDEAKAAALRQRANGRQRDLHHFLPWAGWGERLGILVFARDVALRNASLIGGKRKTIAVCGGSVPVQPAFIFGSESAPRGPVVHFKIAVEDDLLCPAKRHHPLQSSECSDGGLRKTPHFSNRVIGKGRRIGCNVEVRRPPQAPVIATHYLDIALALLAHLFAAGHFALLRAAVRVNPDGHRSLLVFGKGLGAGNFLDSGPHPLHCLISRTLGDDGERISITRILQGGEARAEPVIFSLKNSSPVIRDADLVGPIPIRHAPNVEVNRAGSGIARRGFEACIIQLANHPLHRANQAAHIERDGHRFLLASDKREYISVTLSSQ